jgi:acetoin utilization deacetylase AcuC-like enzyme
VRAYAHDGWPIPLPAGHRFPSAKYALVRGRAEAAGIDVRPSPAATREDAALAHAAHYLDRVEAGGFDRREELRLGLPWSPQLVARAFRSVGATLAAAGAALADGAAANVGGGTHHAFPDRASGYCVLNDVVVAIRRLRAAGRVERVLVIDLDVHQGDGTNLALAGDARALTCAINGGANYPFRRVPGDLEIDLPDCTGDERYLNELGRLLPAAIRRAAPELCFYLAGADPYVGDRLGRLALSKPGLAERDRMVRDALRAAGVPVCITLAGGYGEDVADTVDIHARTLTIFAGVER